MKTLELSLICIFTLAAAPFATAEKQATEEGKPGADNGEKAVLKSLWHDQFNYDEPEKVKRLKLNAATKKWEQDEAFVLPEVKGTAGKETITGTIRGFRHVELTNPVGWADAVTLVLIRQKDDEGRMIVNLGPRADLEGLGLKKGQEVTIGGSKVKLTGHEVFRAETLSFEGKTRQIDIGVTKEDDKLVFGVTGTVADFRQVKIKDREHRHTVVRLEMKKGGSVLVDFGATSMPDLGIDKGDKISVRGLIGKISDKPVLIARAVRVSGQVKEVHPTPESGM